MRSPLAVLTDPKGSLLTLPDEFYKLSHRAKQKLRLVKWNPMPAFGCNDLPAVGR